MAGQLFDVVVPAKRCVTLVDAGFSCNQLCICGRMRDEKSVGSAIAFGPAAYRCAADSGRAGQACASCASYDRGTTCYRELDSGKADAQVWQVSAQHRDWVILRFLNYIHNRDHSRRGRATLCRPFEEVSLRCRKKKLKRRRETVDIHPCGDGGCAHIRGHGQG